MTLSLIVLLLTMALGIPVAFSIGLSALAYFLDSGANLLVLPQQFIGQINNISLLAIPFFILAGELMNTSGVTRRIFDFALACVGRVPGGLGHTNVVAGMIFSGISGSAVADLASIGKVGLKAMRENDYPDDLSLGAIVSTSTLGPIIPPSINMVIFGSIANVPIGLLFLGGIGPGVITGTLIMATFAFLFWRRKVVTKAIQPGSFWSALKNGIWSLLTPFVLLGTMFVGIATPTEAAIIACLYVIIVGMFVYRELTPALIFRAVFSSTILSGAIMLIIAFAKPLGYAIARNQVASELISGLTAWSTNATVILLLVTVALLIVGCFMEVAAAIILLTPVVAPALTMAGFDPIFVGVFVVYILGVGLVTPPVGLCLYVGSQVAKVPLETVIWAVVPFIPPLIITGLLLIAFPSIITGIPSMFY